MNVTKASYGGKDATEEVKKRIKHGKLIIRADNSIIGDPQHGTVKYLELEIENQKFKIKENDLFSYPEIKTDRLGIFYSNNNNEIIYPTIRASLKSIEKAADKKADILTCMWRSEPQNPFFEKIAWTQTSSHLNQILQILQLLYTASEIGNYKYVSFLEHDLLYAEGCFDYPDFNDGILVNTNFIGMNTKGFQAKNQKDKPLSQIIMLFKDAIEHFRNILPNALLTNSGCSEPQKYIMEWHSKWPNIHVNHGFHFTSHCDIYSKTTHENEEYWGNHKSIWPQPPK